MVKATLFALAASTFFSVHAIDLDVNNVGSIKSAASSIASDLVTYYNGNNTGETPGLLPSPYFWWEAGALFNSLIKYWYLTGDEQYNGIVSQALLFQQGENGNYMPENQTKSLGNDDQSTWALAAMSAAEEELPQSGNTSWVGLAEAVFNTQAVRWDTKTCGGGLRWQVFTFNNGYTYKNSVSNGQFFELAARLARYTGNSTYSDWALKAFDWSRSIGLVDDEWNVYDGAQTTSNCSDISHIQFSWSAATYLSGAAYMYNVTSGDSKWKSALDGLLNNTLSFFFTDGIAVEVPCESRDTCNVDQLAFKGLLANAFVDTIQVAPYTSSSIIPKLQSSAKAAAKSCGDSGCAFIWTRDNAGSDDNFGVGQDLSALGFVQGLLVKDAASPVTEGKGASNATATSTGASTSASGTQSGSTSSGTGAATPTDTNTGSIEKAGMELLAVFGIATMWFML